MVSEIPPQKQTCSTASVAQNPQLECRVVCGGQGGLKQGGGGGGRAMPGFVPLGEPRREDCSVSQALPEVWGQATDSLSLQGHDPPMSKKKCLPGSWVKPP